MVQSQRQNNDDNSYSGHMGHTYKSVFSAGRVHIWIILVWAFIAFSGCTGLEIFQNDIAPEASEQHFWPHERSDLSPDPSLHFGRLDNGFRYIFKENTTPSDRVSMHLYIQAGSLVESEAQQGIAHFLEHMQFDGSSRFAPDEMVKYFQRIGMQFGPDANAHTGFSETVYDIILPKGDDQSLAEAMQVLHEFAQGALLLPQQIEKEKKVVLAEKRSRDSADYRIMKAAFAFEMPGTLPPQRFPIGKDETIKRFDQTMLRRFYDQWYRPENMVLIIVGQFNADSARQLAEKQFAALRPRHGQAERPALGNFNHQGLKTFYYPEKNLGSASVRIETAMHKPQPPDSRDYQRQSLLNTLADQIVNERLSKLLRQPGAVMTDAGMGTGYFLQTFHFASISAECTPENWAETLQQLEQVLRQALQYGFTSSELARAKKSIRAQLQKAMDAEPTRDSNDIARDLISGLRNHLVIRSASQDYQLFGELLQTMTADQVHKSFIENWSAPHRLVMVTGNAEIADQGAQPNSYIEHIYTQSASVPVSAPEDETTIRFPYLPDPPIGKGIWEQNFIKDIGVAQVDFPNGIHLVMKKTPFKAGEVLVSLSFGHGKASEPEDLPGLADLTEALLNEAGFGAMDRTDLENALAGHLATIQFDIREDMFQVVGQTVAEDLPLLFQLLYAFIRDPGYRPESLDLVRSRLEQQFVSASHDVQGVMRIKGGYFLSGGDSRFALAAPQDLEKITMEQIKMWFDPQLKNTPMEIAVVGDIDTEIVKSLTDRYLGSLPPRNASGPASESNRNPTFPAGQTAELKADSKIDKTLVVVAYPTDDFWDIGRTRRLSLLSTIFSERLRVSIREKLGAAYSPFAYNRSYRVYPDFGIFQVHLMVDPKLASAVISEVKQIARELGRQPVSPDEFRRSLDPTLTQIKDLRQSNNYWLHSVLSASSRFPQQLDWARTIEKDYAVINAEEIQALAAKYLIDKKTAVVVIQPHHE